MKKILSLGLVLLLTLSLVACSSNNDTDSNNSSKQKNIATDRDLKEGDYEEKGNGNFLIACTGGTTEGGNVPVEYIAPDTSISQIGYETSEFDGSKLSFIYVNGMLLGKEQLADSQSTFDLQGDLLKPGIYKVEVIQYDGDEPANEMVTYKTCEYEIKEK